MASNIVGQRRNGGGAAAGGGETPEGVPQKSDTLSIAAAAPPAVIVVANGQIEVNTKTLIAAAAVNGVNGGEKVVVMNGRATEAAERSPVKDQRLGRGQSAPKLLLDGPLLTTLCEENGTGGDGHGTEKEARRKEEGKENGGAGILETMKAKMMTMKTNNNISNSRNRNNTLPPLPLTNGLRHRVHRSQSPSLFGSTKVPQIDQKRDLKEHSSGKSSPIRDEKFSHDRVSARMPRKCQKKKFLPGPKPTLSAL
uniref:Uncharacterized protein n=1 Tax=Globodera pallida TaxID=36090 RepID=A0A183C213_GLOPA